jgi:hypothetical protein
MPLLWWTFIQIKKKVFLIRSKDLRQCYPRTSHQTWLCLSRTNLNRSAYSSAVPEVVSKHASSSNVDSSCYQQQKYHTLTTSQCCAATEVLHRFLQQTFSNSTTHHAPLATHINMWARIFQPVATRYGLGGPGIESRWEADSPHSSWTVLGTIQPPVQWVPVFFSGDKAARRWCWPHIPI